MGQYNGLQDKLRYASRNAGISHNLTWTCLFIGSGSGRGEDRKEISNRSSASLPVYGEEGGGGATKGGQYQR